jgi:hypothetical protein
MSGLFSDALAFTRYAEYSILYHPRASFGALRIVRGGFDIYP